MRNRQGEMSKGLDREFEYRVRETTSKDGEGTGKQGQRGIKT